MNARTPPLVIIAPMGAPARRPRLEKTIRLAQSRGIPVEFWGWRRTAAEDMGAGLPGVVRTRTLLTSAENEANVRRLYPRWMAAVLRTMLSERPRRVIALGLESALPVWLASLLTRSRYVFDDADRLLLVVNLPGPIRKLVRFAEKRTSRSAVTHIIPGRGRYDYETAKMFVVANTPDAEQVSAARALHVERPEGRLIVYVNGWLAPTRGLELLKEVSERLPPEEGIRFLVAAKTNTPTGEAFARSPNCHFLGSLSQVDALAWYKAVDLVATFYDPSVPINRYAEPNKWGDAMLMGVPVLVNQEVVTAGPLLEAGAAFATPYSDPDGLIALLKDLRDQPSRLAEARQTIEALGRDAVLFDRSISIVLDHLMGVDSPRPA